MKALGIALLGGALATAAVGQPAGPSVGMLSGWFQLPTVCDSKSAFERVEFLMTQPYSQQRDEEVDRISSGNCQVVPAQSGFIVRRVEGRFTLVELVDVNANRQPGQISKGLWWGLTTDIETYQSGRGCCGIH